MFFHESSPSAYIRGRRGRELVKEVVFFEENIAGKRFAISSSNDARGISNGGKLLDNVRPFLYSWLFL